MSVEWKVLIGVGGVPPHDVRLLREEIARLRAGLEVSGALSPRDEHHPRK